MVRVTEVARGLLSLKKGFCSHKKLETITRLIKKKMRILKSHPLLKLVNAYVIDSPQPSNIRYLNLPRNPHGFKPFPCKSAGD